MILGINREQMVEEIEKRFKLHPYVKKAFLEINRRVFVPTGFGYIAYQLDALPMKENQ